MGSPHISFTVSLSFHKHLNGTQLNVTPTPQDSVKLAFTWRHVWELKFSGARSHRTSPSSLWAQNPVRFLFLSLLFSFTTSSLTLKISECIYWLSWGCQRWRTGPVSQHTLAAVLLTQLSPVPTVSLDVLFWVAWEHPVHLTSTSLCQQINFLFLHIADC